MLLFLGLWGAPLGRCAEGGGSKWFSRLPLLLSAFLGALRAPGDGFWGFCIFASWEISSWGADARGGGRGGCYEEIWRTLKRDINSGEQALRRRFAA